MLKGTDQPYSFEVCEVKQNNDERFIASSEIRRDHREEAQCG